MQTLHVFQSMWAMEDGSGGAAPLAPSVAAIRDAGYQGVSDHYTDPAHIAALTRALEGTGMGIEGCLFPRTVGDIRAALRLTRDFPVRHLTAQVDLQPHNATDALPFLRESLDLAAAANVPLFIETHRGRLTSDLHQTLDLITALPDLPLTADLSHYVVGREITLPPPPEVAARMARILTRARSFHGRIATSEQVQAAILFPQNAPWLAQFRAWWAAGFALWRAQAPADATLVFTCELGPPPYAVTDRHGHELTDRRAEALALKQIAQEIWAQGNPCTTQTQERGAG